MHRSRNIFASIAICTSLIIQSCQVVNPPLITATPTPEVNPNPTSTVAPTPTEDVLRGTVSIWHSWDERQLPGLLKAIDAFQTSYPNVLFDVQYIPSIDLKSSFEAASVEGSAPTLLIGSGEWGPPLFDKGWLADISDLAAEELLNSLNPAAVGAAQNKQALIGLPVDIDGVVLYRNRRLIPSAASTFEDLVSFARQATQGDVTGAYLDRSFFFSGGHLSGIGGNLMTPDGFPAFNDDHGLAWVELLRSFEGAGPTEFLGDNDLQYFKENRAGYITESTTLRNSLSESIGTANLAIDPWPILEEGGLSGYVEAEMVYLAPHAIEQLGEPAWEFAQYLVSPEAQSYLAETGTIPAIRASYTPSGGSQVIIDDELIRQAMLALESGTTYPVMPEMDVYPSNMNIALQSIFFDGVAPEEALQSAEERITEAVTAIKSPGNPSP